MPTRFAVQDVERVIAGNGIVLSLPDDLSTLSESLVPSSLVVYPALVALLRQATHISRLLNGASRGTHQKLNSLQVHGTFVLLGYRLQALLPLLRARNRWNTAQLLPATLTTGYCTDGPAAAEEAIYLGLTAFIVSVLRGGGCGKMNSGPLSWVCDAARSVGRMSIMRNSWEWESVLWMTFVGVAALVYHESDIEEWAVTKAAECVAALGLVAWEDAVNVLGRWPWIDALHGKRGLGLWERCSALSLHSVPVV
ncbi:uncharacterized protein B0T15DRAFT_325857 [Chaetomium strumarium]|uniref:Uncharacterized protein n=1 Tax=Chaetomium strumarium TaxID=1170767 RepID=A0AAJ0LY31_9PEZI|nr:hypothetical protein B0T15DRAFT_325857 [Chaetomium strumarium]